MLRNIFIYGAFTVLGILSNAAYSQNITNNGRINTKHFSINDFGSAGQIWTGLQEPSGNLLFGNRQDILSFNGVEWIKIKTDRERTSKKIQDLVNDSYVSKLYLASDDKVYVGRNNNFGYLDYSSKGELVYFPLYSTAENKEIGQVWNVFELGDNSVLFVAEHGLFKYKDKKIKPIPLPPGYLQLKCKTSCRMLNGIFMTYQSVDEDFKIRQEKYLYFDLLSGSVKELKLPKNIEVKNIRGSFQLGATWYIVDAKSKIYSASGQSSKIKWEVVENSKFPCLTTYFVNSVTKSGDYLIAATENDGLVIGDLNGNILRIYNLEDDLANLTVNVAFFDNSYNLWLCLGNGIQFIETGSPLSYFHKNEGVSSQIETIDFNSGKVLIGTHNGIITPTKKGLITAMQGHGDLNEIIFDIETNRGSKTPMVIGYNGIFKLDPTTGKAISASPQYAIAFEQDPNNPNKLFFTLENGLAQLTFDGKKWNYESLVQNAGGETVSLTHLNNTIYFSIRSKGIGVYDLKSKKFSIIPIKQLNKEDQNNNYYVESFKGELFAGTANGMFVLDKKNNRFNLFEPSKAFKVKDFKNTIHRIIAAEENRLWVVIYQDKKDGKFENIIGWFEKRGNQWEWTTWPLTGLKNAGLVFAVEKNPLANEVWIGANDGLFILNQDAIRKNRNLFRINIDRFEVQGKPFLFNLEKAKQLEGLDYGQNTFKFIFHANNYSSLGAVQYSYKLDGFSDQWSQWSSLNFANFEKIPEGKYIFKVKAKSVYGFESEILTYKLTVYPPWYRTTWAYIFYIVLLIVLIYGVVQLSTQRVKRQNLRLEEIVQERTKEIAEQNHQLEKQKFEITAKTQDILDSIHYAKRIQNTILPVESRLNELFDEHFVFYRPKDIVSGDFYWAREVQGQMVFAAVDCTGHGVPGALVSIVGNNGLLRAVNEFKLTAPNEILDKLREIVLSAFRAEGQVDVKDGMDIALCSIDPKTGILRYAGANNECVIIRNGEIIELKPDKQPIGQFVDAKPFQVKEFQLEHDDCIYLYTDGYVDQFGGDRLKKFKSKPFKAMLSTIYKESMENQYIHIQRAFDDWKQDIEQVDDVCVFGVKYKSTLQ